MKATHIMGGEITWECQNNGQYIFILKVYRDCNGITFGTNNLALEAHNYPSTGVITLIPLNFFSVTDITPSCQGSPCATLSQSDPDIPGAVEEYILKSNPTTINGVPPNNGWTFTWTSGNRNAAIDNIQNASNFGITLRAVMFPFNGQNANPCFDSSPDFFQKPSTIICGGEQFTYNHSAYDNELDSLVYSWAQPLDGQFCNNPPCQIGGVFQKNTNPTILPFDAGNGYSFNSPFPDTNLDVRNIPAVLDANTGEITFTSFNTGEFVSVIQVDAYKCGVKVAEIYRELQTIITTSCASNEPPIIPPPFANGTYNDTVKAGDLIKFDINVYDTLRTDNPKNDSIFFYASGIQFGTNYTDSTSGCLNPPCATLTNALPDTAVGTYTTQFSWQSTCDHIADNTPNCISTQNSYSFVIRAFDDFCPAAGQSIATITIVVQAKDAVPNPDIHCADVQSDGSVIIDWNQTSDPDSSFIQWKIYRASNINGPYVLIDSISSFNSTTYSDLSANANNQSIHYIVRAESACDSQWLYNDADTISTMFIDPTFNNNCVTVNWNTLDSPLPSGSDANYQVYREYPIGSGFTLYKTQSGTTFCDTFNVCTDTVTYRIFIGNSGNGCVGSSSNIKGIRFQYPLPTQSVSANNVSCFGSNDGMAWTTPSNGSAPYTYTWNNSQSTDTIQNLSPNTYTVTLADSKGCTNVNSVSITQPNALITSINSSSNVSCSGQADGQAIVSVNGGTMPYTYFWSDSQASDTAKNLTVGIYYVTVTDLNGCTDSSSTIITQPLVLTASIGNSSNISCNGLSDGWATVNPNGGTSPYTYLWSDNQTTDTAMNLTAGTYTITVTDLNGCTDVSSVIITQPTTLNSNATIVSNTSCNGFSDGKAVASALGGTTPYSYLWSDNQNTDTAFNLIANTYTVTVTDNNGCTAISSVAITEPNSLSSSIASSTDVSCNGLSDGQAIASATGGTNPYSYLWSDNQNTATASNLTANSYTITITDNNGCTTSTSVSITEPPILSASINNATNVSCNGQANGQATASAIGGTTPYTYAWPSTNSNAIENNLAAGTYTVTVTDNNGCTDTSSTIITEPPLLNATILSSSAVSCNGLSDGTATATASGGTIPYTYLWPSTNSNSIENNLTAGTYTVTVTDNEGCTDTARVIITEPILLSSTLTINNHVNCNGGNDGQAYVSPSGGTSPYSFLWSDNQTTDTARNLIANTYTVTVTDNKGCTDVKSISVNEPNVLTSTINHNVQVSCNGLSDGLAAVTVSGGTLPYTYLWSDNQTTDTARNLIANTYTVTVSDLNGCTDSASIIITQPATLISSIVSSTNVNCNGLANGQAIATASGGTSPYTYLWNDNQTSDTAKNLAANSYFVTISDANGCTDSSSIIITEPTALSSTVSTINNVSCNGLSDGQAYITPNGGSIPYTFNWSDNQLTDTARNLAANSYTVTITDNNGCTDTNSISITEPNVLTAAIGNSDDVSCYGLSDGQAIATANGGTAPYSYLWSNNQSSDTSKNLIANTYTVTITDANGCTDSSVVIITQADSLSTSITVGNNVSCFGLFDGLAFVTASGGSLPYTYLWSDNQITDTALNLISATYTVTITDINNCIKIDSTFISQPNILSTIAINSSNVSCHGLSDGWANFQASGGTLPYSYSWSNNQTTDTAKNLIASSYTVTITDLNGCIETGSIMINEPDTLITTALGSAISCFGFNDGTIRTTTSGGSIPYSFIWSSNQTSDSINNLSAGTYTVTITDLNNCSDTSSFEIIEPLALSVMLSDDDTICVNSIKTIVANVNGGTIPYSYSWSNNSSNTNVINVTPRSNTTYSVSITDRNNCPIKTDSVAISVRNLFDDQLTLNSTGNICLNDSSELSYIHQGDFPPYTYTFNNGLPNINPQWVSPISTTQYVLRVRDICNNVITDTVLVEVSDLPTINLADTLIEGCVPLTIRPTNQTPSNFNYVWRFGNGDSSTIANPIYTYHQAGNYLVNLYVSTPEGCENNSTVNYNIEAFPTPEAIINASKTITDLENASIQFSSDFSDANSWQWNFGNGDNSTLEMPTITYQDTGRYLVSLYELNQFNCSDSAFIEIYIQPSYTIKIPNVFTPNTNGSTGGRYNPNSLSNEIFHPFIEYTQSYHLMIFNRWGELVFESKDVNIGWDGYYKGKLSQADVYVYKLEVTFINGEKATKVGDVTLLR